MEGSLEGSHGDRVRLEDGRGHRGGLHHYQGLNFVLALASEHECTAHPAIVESVARTFAGWDGADAAEDRSVTRFRVWHAAARADINEGMAA